MPEVYIRVSRLRKVFRMPRRHTGFLGSLRTLVTRQYEEKVAVDGISFAIEPGEIVGYVGPNGAGKSTTIKVLTGILVPSAGDVTVGGLVPYANRKENARRIGVVFGQRSQLWWDLPILESFRLHRDLYYLEDSLFRRNLDMMVDLLELSPLLNTPTRQLSLGQRMRAELAMAFLHSPEVVFLDEPTIGLDVVVKQRIREFIKEFNRQHGTTVILTTHDMSDIEKVCHRMLMINRGKVVYDGAVDDVRTRYGTVKTLMVEFENECAPLSIDGVNVARTEGPRQWLKFDQMKISAVDLLARAGKSGRVRDMSLEEPEIEEIVRRMYLDEPENKESSA